MYLKYLLNEKQRMKIKILCLYQSGKENNTIVLPNKRNRTSKQEYRIRNINKVSNSI